MDLITIISLLASIAGILAFLYLAILGQRSIPEMLPRRNKESAAEQVVVRHNVPQFEDSLIGRDQEYRRVVEALAHSRRTYLVSIEGFSGIGKTSLALQVAHHYLSLPTAASDEQEYDVVVWLSAKAKSLTEHGLERKHDTPTTLEDLFATIAIVLKKDEILRTNQHYQRELIRSQLATERVLLVIDNIETLENTTEILDFLYDLPTPTKCLITTRYQIENSFRVILNPLDTDETGQLIRAQCIKKNINLDPTTILQLAEYSAGIPIVVVWSIGQIAVGYDPHRMLGRLMNRDHATDLVQYCFEETVAKLSHPQEYHALLTLSLFDDPISNEALRFVTGYADEEIRKHVLSLARISLAVLGKNDRISVLPITRTFAREELRQDKHEGLYDNLRTRLVVYFREFVMKYGGENPNIQFLTADLRNIEVALETAKVLADWESYALLLSNISRFLYVRGLYSIGLRFWDTLLGEKSITANPVITMKLVLALTQGIMYAYLRNNRGGEILRFFEENVSLFRQANQLDELSTILQRAGIVSRDLKQFDKATLYLSEAYQIAITLPETESPTVRIRRQADALNGLGSIAVYQGDYVLAKQLLESANVLFLKIGDYSTRSSVVRHIAETERLSGKYRAAATRCREAIEMANKANRSDRLADAYREMAQIYVGRKRLKQARIWAERARELYMSIGAVSNAEGIALMVSGLSYLSSNKTISGPNVRG